MAATLLWDNEASSGQKPQESALEDLFVFGYACKLFRDDDRANHIDEGKHLIPWMGDERLMIDRYDGRGHLYDLTKYDADLVKGMPVELSEEETAVEAACDEERYLELVIDVQEKVMYEEEEWKRYYESLHEGYNAVGFSYEQSAAAIAQQNKDTEEEEDETFIPPKELAVPEGIELPQTEKEHARIEKTAIFIAKHGIQMEIMIKTKQSKNAQFEFMNFENPLNLYYQHLVKMIKEGKYRPNQLQEQKLQEQDQTGHYLHPSLSTATLVTPLPPPPPLKPIVLPKVSIHDTPYGQLISSLKKYSKSVKKEEKDELAPPPLPPFMAQPDYDSSSDLDTLPSATIQHSTQQPKIKEESLEPPPPGTEVMGPLPRPSSQNDSQSSENRSSPQPQIVPPPPDVQPIIDRMAMYVAKNGIEFELVVKSKRDQRFSFLEPGHVHYQYYDFKKNMFLKEAELKRRLEAKQAERERQKKEEAAAAQANRSISFSIKGRNKEPESMSTLKRALFDYDSSDGEGDGEEGGRDGDKESKSGNSTPDHSLTASVAASATTPLSTGMVTATETKPSLAEDMEKKHAEERVKDKLAVAARDKLAASTKEKQLQAERKKKAALFINLLRIVKEAPINNDKEKDLDNTETKSTPTATPAGSKPASPEVFEYNNRSGTPTRLNDDMHHKHKTSHSKSPSESHKKRRKKSPTPPSAYANPHRSPPRYSPAQRRSRSPRRGNVGSRRISPIRSFRSRQSPSPRRHSPQRKKTSSKRSRSPSQSPSASKHKKKHKRSRSKTPKKKKKDKTHSQIKEHESKSGRQHDKSSDRHKDRDKKKDKEKKKDRDKDRQKSKTGDNNNSSSSKTDKNKQSNEAGKHTKNSSSSSHDAKPHQLSPPASSCKAQIESKQLSPVPEKVESCIWESSSQSEDEDGKNDAESQQTESSVCEVNQVSSQSVAGDDNDNDTDDDESKPDDTAHIKLLLSS